MIWCGWHDNNTSDATISNALPRSESRCGNLVWDTLLWYFRQVWWSVSAKWSNFLGHGQGRTKGYEAVVEQEQMQVEAKSKSDLVWIPTYVERTAGKKNNPKKNNNTHQPCLVSSHHIILPTNTNNGCAAFTLIEQNPFSRVEGKNSADLWTHLPSKWH